MEINKKDKVTLDGILARLDNLESEKLKQEQLITDLTTWSLDFDQRFTRLTKHINDLEDQLKMLLDKYFQDQRKQ